MSKKLLLDTCVILWILEGNNRISRNQKLLPILNSSKRYFSPVSIAEMAIKKELGKLEIDDNYLEMIKQSGIEETAFNAESAYLLDKLPHHHKDPFDRMIICSAMNKGFSIVTGDMIFKKYPLEVFLV